MYRRFTIVLAASALLLAACGGSDDESPAALSTTTVQSLDATLDAELKSANLPSAAVGICIGGQPVYLTAKGSDQVGFSSRAL